MTRERYLTLRLAALRNIETARHQILLLDNAWLTQEAERQDDLAQRISQLERTPWTTETLRDAHALARQGYTSETIALAIGIEAARVEAVLPVRSA